MRVRNAEYLQRKAEKRKARLALNPELRREKARARRKRNPERYRQKERERRKRNPEKYQQKERVRSLKKYGLIPESYDAWLEGQKGVCAVCRKPPTTRRLSVDFNKKTQAVRGLLCWRCAGLLRITRNLDILTNALNYCGENNCV